MVTMSPKASESVRTVSATIDSQQIDAGNHSGIPIVFIHKNYSPYLEFTLRQAAFSNPNSPIYLLGDDQNNRFPFLIHRQIDAYENPDSDYFKKVYEHYSPNHYDYELFCFIRWYLVRELMKREGFSEVFVADSDVMIYANITEYISQTGLRNTIAAFNIGSDYQWVRSASGHSSYWTWEGIELFCKLAADLYTEPRLRTFMEQIRSEKIIKNDRAGISDMTALYVFYEQEKARIRNLSECRDDTAFDHNICMATNFNLDEYEFGLGQKKVVIKKGYPVAYNRLLKKEIRLHTLHFQGNSKKLIHRYFTANGLLARKLFREFRFLASVLYHMVRS
ncbi:hypothetical protein ACFPMF_03840 [Larkinella bovis]|uniref:Nucleotide-diphospho-sugar transferase domain-containing protein n=1 Tax=Larkinella bovis TaxID=683041 RepID=A0ABW0I720_9BACT